MEYWLHVQLSIQQLFILKVLQPHFRFASVCLLLTWRKADWEQHKHRKPVGIIQREKGWPPHINPGYRDHLRHYHHILTCMFVYIQVTQAEGAGGTAPCTVSWACAQSTGGSALVTMGVASEQPISDAEFSNNIVPYLHYMVKQRKNVSVLFYIVAQKISLCNIHTIVPFWLLYPSISSV